MKFKLISLAVILCLVIAMPLQAEYVFLKNGSIIEGKIVTDAADSITVRDKENRVKTVPRNSIMRILYTSLKMGKIYIQKRDGEGLVAFMVDEDRDSYTFRKELYRPEEFTLQRSDVLFIAEKNPSGLKGTAETDRVSLTWLPPYDSVKNYNVYYSSGKNEKYKLAGTPWGKSYTLSGLSSNTTYYIIVTSVDSDAYESSPSNELKITTPNIPPDAPGNLKKNVTSDGKIILTWEPSKDPDGEVKGYKVFTREKHKGIKESGSTAKTEYTIKGADIAEIKQISVKAVDDKGDLSEETEFYGEQVVFTLKPVAAFPFGKMKDLFSSGYGASLGFSAYDYLFDNSIISIESGFIRWGGNIDSIDYMNMFTSGLSFGYRFHFSDQVSLSITAGGGCVYMSTTYTDAAFETATSTAFEPLIKGGVSFDYNITDSLSFSAGGSYNSIYEESGMRNFADAFLSISYIIF